MVAMSCPLSKLVIIISSGDKSNGRKSSFILSLPSGKSETIINNLPHIHLNFALSVLLLFISSCLSANKLDDLNSRLIENAQLQQQKLVDSYGLHQNKQWLNRCDQLIEDLALIEFNQCLVIKANFTNAYSLAHGTVILTEGLLNNINNDDQLAHVLAHEHAHLSLKHHQQTQALITKPPKLFTKSRIKKFYREIEQQADQAADNLLTELGRDHLQIHHYLMRIEKNHKEHSNDHQKLKDRIQRDHLPKEVIEPFWNDT